MAETTIEGRELRVGVAGLGGAAKLILPYFDKVAGVVLAGAADTREEARAAFAREYAKPVFASVEDLCRSDHIDAVWIETPNHLHCEHALTAARHGKHIICAKPLAVSLDECDRMIAAADRAGVQLLQGHSKIFDAPIQAMRAVVAEGHLGRAIQVDTWLFNDWLQRPRLAEELDPTLGGGITLRQGPHLVDIATYIIGAGPRSVRAVTGRWDANFATTGNFTALLDFGGGVAASLSLNGYGRFDGSELYWGIGAMGARRETAAAPRPRRTGVLSAGEKYALPVDDAAQARRATGDSPPFFGLTIVSCEHGVIRQSPNGLFIYTDAGVEEVAVPAYVGRAAELIELRDAIAGHRPAFPDGRWAKATLETCLAIEASGRSGADVALAFQRTVDGSPFAKPVF